MRESLRDLTCEKGRQLKEAFQDGIQQSLEDKVNHSRMGQSQTPNSKENVKTNEKMILP